MELGSRVRLNKKRMPKGNHPIDWRKRRGTVVRIGQFNNTIYVQWDGRRTIDPWPEKALTVCSFTAISNGI